MNDNFLSSQHLVHYVLPGEARKKEFHALDLIDSAIPSGKGV